MKNAKQLICAATISALALGVYAITPAVAADADPMLPKNQPQHDAMMGNDAMAQKDIIETATGPGMEQVTTVVAAIKAAGLVDTLKGKGPFTVFAPTNAAFDKLPKGTVDDLLKPENKEKLKSILLYHVHAGDAIKAADVKTMSLSTAKYLQELGIKGDALKKCTSEVHIAAVKSLYKIYTTKRKLEKPKEPVWHRKNYKKAS